MVFIPVVGSVSFTSQNEQVHMFNFCWLCQRTDCLPKIALEFSWNKFDTYNHTDIKDTTITSTYIYICNIEREKYRERCSILLTVHMCIHMFIAFHSNGVPAGLWFGLCIGCAQQRLWRAFGGARGLVTRWPLSGGRCKGKYGKTLGKLRVKLKKTDPP